MILSQYENENCIPLEFVVSWNEQDHQGFLAICSSSSANLISTFHSLAKAKACHAQAELLPPVTTCFPTFPLSVLRLNGFTAFLICFL